MSLIYTAITSLEKKHAAMGMPGEPHVLRQPPQPNQAAPVRWLYAAGIGSVTAVVIGGAALAVLRVSSREAPPPMAASVQTVAAPAPQMAAQLPAQQALPAVSAPLPQVSAPAPVVKPVEPAPERAPVDPEVTEHQARRSVLPTPAASSKPARRAYPAPAAVAVVVESAPTRTAIDDLNHLAAAAKQAIDAGNQDEAEFMLGKLAARLPSESITLMRLRAWQALRNNDQPRAMTLYGQIVERLPEDEPASINLAVLNWKAGQRDEARRILSILAERHPDSETVRRYVIQFGERQ